jgi:hypothetical protein
VTSKGLALLKRAPEPFQERLIEALENLPVSRRKLLSRELSRVVRSAGLTEGPAPLFFEERRK